MTAMPTTCSPTVTYKRGPLTPSEHEQFIPLRQHWTPQCYFLTRQFIYYYHLEPQLWTDLVLKAESMMGEWEELQTQQQRSGLSETEQLACAKAVKEVHDKMEELLRGGGVLAGFYTAFIAAAARRGITQAEVDKAAESFGYQEAFTLDQVEDRVREERAKEHHIDEELRSPRADRIMDDFGPSNTSSPSSSQSSRSSRASATSQISNTIPALDSLPFSTTHTAPPRNTTEYTAASRVEQPDFYYRRFHRVASDPPYELGSGAASSS
ncbi:hypothetical protein JCM11641_008385 [Rhodosporidiobolus odoratus]